MLPSSANYVGECNTCTPSTSPACERLPYLHVYLNALKDFTTKYSTKPGFNKFITGEATAIGDLKQDGAYFLMKDLNSTSYAATVNSLEGKISEKMPNFPVAYECADCAFDVEESGNILVDYKSVGCSWSLSGKKIKQFKQYLQYWSNNPNLPLRGFKYIFNSEKLTLQQAKQKFVALLKTDPITFYNINPAFFNRIDRTDGSNRKVSNATQFEVELNKTNFWQNPIFDFVSIVP